jgi:probable rRNA maturation factor
MISVEFIDETETIDSNQQLKLDKLLQLAAEMEKVSPNAEVSVTFVDNNRIHEINKEFRGIDRPTDVISFALEEQGEGEISIVRKDGLPTILGDIIISIPKAKEQAKDYGHSFNREIGFLLTHGFLHLLGYDHMNEDDENKMFNRQEEILQQYGLKR